MDHILRANRHRRVPAWVHDLALAQDYRSWAGRVDCPTPIAQALIERDVATADAPTEWNAGYAELSIATLVVARGDLDIDALKEATTDTRRLEILDAIATGVEIPHLIKPLSTGYWNRDGARFSKHLNELHVKGRVAMSHCEWMVRRGWASDVMVSKLAFNVANLGDRTRLLQALRSITGQCQLAHGDLGYLCRHGDAHGVTNPECLYSTLGQYDAAMLIGFASEWAIGWLDVLDADARSVALAVLRSNATGTSMSDVTDVARGIVA
jgi:hypothetical protein